MPRLVVAGAAAAIDCYARVFGASEAERYAGQDGKIVHAELAIGDARLTLKDEDGTDRAPTSAGGSPVLLMLQVDDADAVAQRMVASGGTVVFPVSDSPHGRGGRIADPFGHIWMISQRAGQQRAGEQFGAAQPDTTQPEGAQPDPEQPDMEQPNAAQPEAATAGRGTAGRGPAGRGAAGPGTAGRCQAASRTARHPQPLHPG